MIALIHTEWFKLRTTRGPWILLAASQAVIVAGVVGFLLTNDPALPSTLPTALAHVGLVSLFAMVLGVMMVAGEYRYRTITELYLAVPRRGPVIAAKLGVATMAGLALGIIGCVTAVVAAAIWFAVDGGSPDWSNSEVWRTLAGSAAWNMLFASIGVGLGALIRNLATAITAALAWIALVEGIVGQLVEDLSQWLPFAAGAALGRMPDQVVDGLSQTSAAVTLAGYAVLFALVALTTGVRRDVT